MRCCAWRGVVRMMLWRASARRSTRVKYFVKGYTQGYSTAQGRRWAEVKSHLGAMWGMALRCADDIKESVRGAAAGALRALRGLTLRLCDPAATPPADAAAAVALALPLLLDQGEQPRTLIRC